jgi:formylglycine-generating enzyme required for sulfatase activity
MVMVPLRTIGRYELFGEIGSGGMATVHLGRLGATGGFAKIVAIKRMHEQLAKDPQFVAMFIDEARLVARIKHPNVRPTLDLIEQDGELSIVMEYVAGVSLRRIFYEMEERKESIPADVAVHILCGVLAGLHAAHEMTGADGEPLMLVHRDVSPENVLIGSDGLSRLLDFGLARALGRLHLTQPGQVKGKLTVMAPEQVQGKPVTRRTDVFASGVVLWQALTAKRLIQGDHIAAVANNVLTQTFEPPSKHRPDLPAELDEVVMRALERDAEQRWPTAEAFAVALEAAVTPAPQRQVAEWLQKVAGATLTEREQMVLAIERAPRSVRAPEADLGARVRALAARASGGLVRARDALRRAVQRDAQGKLEAAATARTIVTTWPRITLAMAGALVLGSVLLVVALSGEEKGSDEAVASEPPRKRTPQPAPSASASVAAPASSSAAPDAGAPPAAIAIPAGEITLGCNTYADRLCAPDEMPPTQVSVDAFAIDRTEVTVKAYQACVQAGACNADHLGSQGVEGGPLEEIDKCNYGRPGREEHPINCVSHAQATAYCRWAGGRLPTEAEWEKAAGGIDGWPFPTGDPAIACDKAVMSDNGDGCGRGTTWPVGAKPAGASPFGALDMAGNVWEWVSNYYEPTYQGIDPKNPKGPAEGTLRVIRGGGWRDPSMRLLRTSSRGKRPAESHAIEIGFRCAR